MKTCLCELDWSFQICGIGTEDFIVGQAVLEAASSKVAKHLKACSDNLNVFISFGFDTFDLLASDAIDLLKRV
jgi:hypothetical protein